MAVIRRTISTKVYGNGNAEILLRFNICEVPSFGGGAI